MGLVQQFRAQNVPKVLAFTIAEYEQRIARCRASMADAKLDLLLVHNMANVCYLTGYETPMSDWSVCLMVPIDGPLTLYACDVGLAVSHTYLENIEWIRWDTMGSGVSQLIEAINSNSGTEVKRVGMDMRRPGLNAHTFKALHDHYADVDFVDATDLLLRLRLIKSPTEIAHLKKAAQYTDAGMGAAISAARAGVTENEVAAAATAAMISSGSEFFSIEPLIRTGIRTSMAHGTYRRNELQNGDAIILEMGGVHNRYTAPLYRTAVVGRPSDHLARLSSICLDALDCLYDNIKPGRTFRDAAVAVHNLITAARPNAEVVPSNGYSVGLGFPPDWVEHSVFIRLESVEVFKPGMVFHTPRSLRAPGITSAGYSETVVVTETGCERLSSLERALIEV
jgi:Xaa-Pro dipeptidase